MKRVGNLSGLSGLAVLVAGSAQAEIAFFDGALAPRVEIVSPRPNPLVQLYVPPTACIEWRGTAFEDDTSAARVVKYKYKVLTERTEVTVRTARLFPDS